MYHLLYMQRLSVSDVTRYTVPLCYCCHLLYNTSRLFMTPAIYAVLFCCYNDTCYRVSLHILMPPAMRCLSHAGVTCHIVPLACWWHLLYSTSPMLMSPAIQCLSVTDDTCYTVPPACWCHLLYNASLMLMTPAIQCLYHTNDTCYAVPPACWCHLLYNVYLMLMTPAIQCLSITYCIVLLHYETSLI